MTAYILNLFDMACTLYAMSVGVEELNPFMRSVPVMVVYKTVIMGLILWWLSARKERLAVRGMRVCIVVYAVLAVWHCVGIIMLRA